MNEREIFLSALEIKDLAARRVHVQNACAGDQALLASVESLLSLNDTQSQFLETPAVAQMVIEPGGDNAPTILLGASSTQDDEPGVTEFASHGPPDMTTDLDDDPDDEDSLGYLEPSTKPGSLGRLAHYEILSILGRGAFGIVLKAFDEKLQRVVAIKVLAQEMAATSPARKRFLREARASAAIRHENVVAIYAVEEKPLPYLVMEYIPGQTLQQRLDHTGPLAVADVLALGRQIAEGLAAAHSKDLIHRDIKPGNILLEEGVHERVKITDFGLARAADDASLTQSSVIAGTPMYMAPEQALGKKLDQRADLFSLGSVLYQMVSGRPPFRAASTLAVLKRVTEDTPRPITEIIPETPQWLCAVISKLHAKNPDGRYQSAAEVVGLLSDYESKLKANSGLTNFDPASNRRQVFALRWSLVTTALLLTAIGAFGIYDMLSSKPAPPEDKPALITPVEPVLTAASSPATVQVVPVSDTWKPLFNGKDLTGWKTHPDRPGDWKVENGILVGGESGLSHLFSERGNYKNFHLRAEIMIVGATSGSLYFHSEYGFNFNLKRVEDNSGFAIPVGYEIMLTPPSGPGSHASASSGPVGAFARLTPPGIEHSRHLPPSDVPKSGDWVMLEVIAQGDQITILGNGKVVLEYLETAPFRKQGHFVLQPWWGSAIHVRKIEIKELPVSPPSLAIAPFDVAQARAHQEAWAKHLGVPVEDTNSIGMKFRLIPPGEFTMGTSSEDAAEFSKGVADWARDWVLSETPARKVQIKEPYYLGTTEVTVGQFKQFVAATGYKTEAETNGRGGDRYVEGTGIIAAPEWTWRHPDLTQSDAHPVGQLCPEDANAFCNWLQKLDGRTYQLPDEEQWEYSCRAGTVTPWSFGASAELAKLHGFTGWNLQFTGREVAQSPANPFGLFDIHGNLSEMCRCQLETYINRGGDSGLDPLMARSASRGYPINGQRSYFQQSFRVAVVGNLKPSAPATKLKTPTLAAVPFTEADISRIAALSATEQVEEVRKELVKRNPGFDGKVEYKIEDGVVTEIRVVTDKMTDIAPIRVFNALRVLDLSGTELDRQGNGQLADLAPLKDMNLSSLTDLSVACTKIDDVGLAYFRNCNNLTGLRLSLTRVTNAGLANFEGCQKLQVLNLKYTKVDDAGLAHFKGCKDLNGVDFGGLNVTDEGLAHFKDCKGLAYLWLNETRVTDVGMASFKDCTTLTHLHLGGTQATNDALANFRDCKDLTFVILGDTKITDAGLVHLKNCKKLSLLNLMNTSVTAGAIDELKKTYPKCRIEWDGGVIDPKVGFAPFPDADVKRIAVLPAAEQVEEVRKELVKRNPGFDGKVEYKIEDGVITEFHVVTDQVTDISPLRAFNALQVLDCSGTATPALRGNGQLADLTPLMGMNLAGLKQLNLNWTQVGDAGLSCFKDCKNLTHLKLWGTRVSDAGIANFKDCENLTGLWLGLTKVSNAGLVQFQNCNNLEDLGLPGTQVDDTGLDYFKDCKKLKGLDLSHTLVTHTGLACFKNSKDLMRLYMGDTKVADLSPLKGMPLKELYCDFQPERDAAILRSIKTLENINGKPAAEFWKDVESKKTAE